MDAVMLVRERTGGCDLVVAILPDGRPAWAFDVERGLQWWYPGGNRPEVRRAIAEQWDALPSLPVAAESSWGGRHPAVELGRRAEASAAARDRAADDLVSRVRHRWTASSRPARVGVLCGVLAVAVIAVSTWLGGPGPSPDPLPVGSDGRTVTLPQVAGAACQVRGELAHEEGGQLLVCVPADRATPWTLSWRPTG